MEKLEKIFNKLIKLQNKNSKTLITNPGILPNYPAEELKAMKLEIQNDVIVNEDGWIIATEQTSFCHRWQQIISNIWEYPYVPDRYQASDGRWMKCWAPLIQFPITLKDWCSYLKDKRNGKAKIYTVENTNNN